MLKVLDLVKRFSSGNREIVAVNGISFEVVGGEVYGLLGPNGAGKTTTLRMVMGLVRPSEGDVTVDGRRVSREPNEVKRRIGLVSASAGLYQWLTPREILAFFGDVYSVPEETAAARIEELSDLMSLSGFLDQRASTLSTGQAQRVNLARALIHDPPLVLMDEPTRGLDVSGSKVVFDYIDHLRSIGKAVIVSTHRLDEAGRLCDRFGLLHRGDLRHEGRLEELQDKTGYETLVDMFLHLLRESDQPAAHPQDA